MSGPLIALFGFLAALVLIGMRIPIAVSLGSVAIVGIGIIRGLTPAYAIIRDEAFTTAAQFSLSAIPMFILMGAFAHHAGLSSSLFRAARAWLSFMPGGLAIASNMACAGFAAASGSSLATTAAIGRITIPEMLKAGYDKGLATGSIAAGGTLGVMIPPSLVFIIYGIFAEVSIGDLFIAGILPGLLTLLIYCLMIATRCALNPSLAPRSEEHSAWSEKWISLLEVWPLLLLVFVVIGSIYGGVATPTEAGACGAFFAIVLSIMQRKFTFHTFWSSVEDTVMTTGRIFFIVIGAVLFSRFMAQAGIAPYLAKFVTEIDPSPGMVVAFAAALFLVLGMFLDALGLLLLTLPILLPMFMAANLDLIWFGVLTVKFVEIGMITPPVGLNVYVLNTLVGDTVSLEEIFQGVFWFLACEVVICGLLITFPEISLVLVESMRR